ncbi:hypothetical protein, partial [Escherichia coli]|uniref:hypothetical protein n=1 Tax=Escherichia coli TaxID=562 RepID=UPI00224F2F62
ADENRPFVIRANYTGSHALRSVESKLSYFREDVGLAAYWATCGYQYAAWQNASEDATPPTALHGGPRLYVLIRNLLARYDMERYSRGLPPVRQAELLEPVEGYEPQVRQISGREFPARPEGLKAKSTDVLSLEDLMDWEGRIRAGVAMSIYLDSAVQIKQLYEGNAMKMIGRTLRGGADTPNHQYYGYVYYGLFTIFGRMMDPYYKYGRTPSVLEVPETMTRDPLFYRILKRMWRVMDGYKNSLVPYTKDELVVQG